MGLVDSLRDQGFKPTLSMDGLWEPYVGTYRVKWEVCRLETDEKNGNVRYIQSEWNILETLEGSPKRESKYSDFRKRYYIEGENGEKHLSQFLNDAFTFGVDVDISSDETLVNAFPKIVGKEGYIRAWGWTPTGKDQPQQSIVIQQQKVAEKKRGRETVGF